MGLGTFYLKRGEEEINRRKKELRFEERQEEMYGERS